MPQGFRVDVSGFRDPSGRFAAVSDAARAAQADAAASLGDVLVHVAMELSPVGQYPFGRPESAGPRFATSWQSRFEPNETGGALVVENTDPKAALVIYPTRPHFIGPTDAHIAARSPKPAWLRFGSPDAPTFARGVMHPGTAGNDVPGKLAQAASGPAVQALQRVGVTAAAALHDALS